MLLVGVSVLLVVVMTGYVMFLMKKYHEKLTCMAAMMIAMTVGMMSSLLIGTVLGTLLNGDLVSPTIIGVLIGMAVGYYTGKPVSLMAAIDGLLAGIMGGMMGAMLGVMVIYQLPTLIIVFMNVIFVIVMLLLVKLIYEEARVVAKKKAAASPKEGSPSPKFYMIGFGVLLLILIANQSGGLSNLFKGANASVTASPATNTAQVQVANGVQEVNITVERFGYSPKEIKMKAGVPAKLHFQKDYRGGCLSLLVMPDLDIQQPLQVGTTTVEVTPMKPGKYLFTCGMGMYGGYLIVES
jgi:hypothetical protein